MSLESRAASTSEPIGYWALLRENAAIVACGRARGQQGDSRTLLCTIWYYILRGSFCLCGVALPRRSLFLLSPVGVVSFFVRCWPLGRPWVGLWPRCLGLGAAFVINAAAYIVLAWCISTVPLPPTPTAENPTLPFVAGASTTVLLPHAPWPPSSGACSSSPGSCGSRPPYANNLPSPRRPRPQEKPRRNPC